MTCRLLQIQQLYSIYQSLWCNRYVVAHFIFKWLIKIEEKELTRLFFRFSWSVAGFFTLFSELNVFIVVGYEGKLRFSVTLVTALQAFSFCTEFFFHSDSISSEVLSSLFCFYSSCCSLLRLKIDFAECVNCMYTVFA